MRAIWKVVFYFRISGDLTVMPQHHLSILLFGLLLQWSYCGWNSFTLLEGFFAVLNTQCPKIKMEQARKVNRSTNSPNMCFQSCRAFPRSRIRRQDGKMRRTPCRACLSLGLSRTISILSHGFRLVSSPGFKVSWTSYLSVRRECCSPIGSCSTRWAGLAGCRSRAPKPRPPHSRHKWKAQCGLQGTDSNWFWMREKW